ncbi:MAG: transposase, partial [Candidatus Gracilibacteria bacterium]|nr:transposase [Candidatus Gracilibacteria bacterium]
MQTNDTVQIGTKVRDYLKPYLRLLIPESGEKHQARQFLELSRGLLQSRKAILSQAARKVLRRRGKKKGRYLYRGRMDNWIKRMSKLLGKLDWEKLMRCHWKRLRERQKSWHMIVHDGSDLAKPWARKMEGLSKVRDGSSGEITRGYSFHGSVGIGKELWDIHPIDIRMVDPTGKNFTCEADVMREQIREMVSYGIGMEQLHVFDRGYDDRKEFAFLDEQGLDWLIRMRKNRKVIYRNERGHTIKLVAESMLEESRENKDGVKYAYHPIWISVDVDGEGRKVKSYLKRYTLIAIAHPKHRNPMMLMTNVPVESLKGAVEMYLNYLDRWKVEDYYRFFKQTLDVETMRLMEFRKLSSFLRLLMLLSDFTLREYHKSQDPHGSGLWELLKSNYIPTEETLIMSPYVVTQAVSELLQEEHLYGFSGHSGS